MQQGIRRGMECSAGSDQEQERLVRAELSSGKISEALKLATRQSHGEIVAIR